MTSTLVYPKPFFLVIVTTSSLLTANGTGSFYGLLFFTEKYTHILHTYTHTDIRVNIHTVLKKRKKSK